MEASGSCFLLGTVVTLWWKDVRISTCCQSEMSLASHPLRIYQTTLNLTWYMWNIFFRYLYSLLIPSEWKENKGITISDRHTFQISCELLSTTLEVLPRWWNLPMTPQSLWKLIKNPDVGSCPSQLMQSIWRWGLALLDTYASQWYRHSPALLNHFSKNPRKYMLVCGKKEQHFPACTCFSSQHAPASPPSMHLLLLLVTLVPLQWFWKPHILFRKLENKQSINKTLT